MPNYVNKDSPNKYDVRAYSGSDVAPVSPAYKRAEPPRTFGEVFAQWAHNLGAGLGVVVMWLIVSYALHGLLFFLGLIGEPWPNPYRVGLAALGAGGAWFGLLMWWRSSLDEMREEGQWQMLEAERDAALEREAETEARWQLKYEALSRDYSMLQAEHKLLVQRKVVGRPADVQSEAPAAQPRPSNVVLPVKVEAQSDAIELLQRFYNRLPWARDAMMREHKWSKGRWEAAKQWLVDSKVLMYGGEKGNVPQWVYPNDYNTALQKVMVRQVSRSVVMSSAE